jgi:hypothetical protein
MDTQPTTRRGLLGAGIVGGCLFGDSLASHLQRRPRPEQPLHHVQRQRQVHDA